VNARPWQPVNRLERIRILVVDENERLLHALLQLLATEPAVDVVGSARSLDEALVQAAALAPQLVLIDWNLPQPATAESCRVMRLHPVTPKIVALLHDDDESYRDSAAAAGADAAVGKGRLSEALLPLLDELFPDHQAAK
jgi:DNA-binding NarL/FixJ family response regulator